MLSGILPEIPKIREALNRETSFFNSIEKALQQEITDIFGEGGPNKIDFDGIGDNKLPFFSMGQINTTHLFGIDELIIFAFYLANKRNYNKVADIGANIGLHSIILRKLGYQVSSFEPDPRHCAQFSENMEANLINDGFALNQVAVSNKVGDIDFTRVTGNTTGSHITGAKGAYGDLEKFSVSCVPFNEILRQHDLVKADVEGHEAVLVSSTNFADWANADLLLEIGSQENANKIYDHLNTIGVSIYSQKIGWRKVGSERDLPKNHREGSVYISTRKEMNWS